MQPSPAPRPRHELATRLRQGMPAAVEFLRPRAIAVALGVGALAVAIWPLQVALAGLAVAAVAVARRGLVVAAVGSAVGLVAFGLASWLAFTLVLLALAVIAVLAVRAPAYGLLASLGLFGTEGTVKAALTYGSSPIGVDPVTLGAAVLDLGLIIAVAGVIWAYADRIRPAWTRLDRLSRAPLLALAAWLVLSLPQIFQNGHLVRGLGGFRVTQAYVIVGLAAFLALSAPHSRRLVRALLVTLGSVAAYAALGSVVGASLTERAFVLSRPGVTTYGDVVRAAGSFSGAVGLASFVVPVAVLSFGIAVLGPHHRRLAGAVFVLATVATIATYSRAAVLGLAAGVLVVSALGITGASRRERRLLIVLVAATFAVGAAATAAASLANAQTRERAVGFVNPFDDRSMRIRYDTWRHSVEDIGEHPLGRGLGTVGRASGLSEGTSVTTDNSYLKVFIEQGVLGGILFLVGLVGIVAACVAGLRRTSGESRAVASACLGGVAAFLVMAIFGEFVEQPGKVVAWTLLGVALAQTTLDKRTTEAT